MRKYKDIRDFWDNSNPKIKESDKTAIFWSSEAWIARQPEIDEYKVEIRNLKKELSKLKMENT